MPEVVEVFLTSQYLNFKIKDCEVTKISILGGRYSRHPMKGLETFKKDLPVKILSINNKGKFMWFECEKGSKKYYILNRFGLEGKWSFIKEKHSNVEFEIKDKDKFYHLYFTDSRNFGTMEITNNKRDLDKELEKLGPDFLKESFDSKILYKRIESILKPNKLVRGEKEIIKVLMDQSSKTGLGSGLGNYLGVEALFYAKISPHTKIGDLFKDKKKIALLSKSIKYVLRLALMTANIGYLEGLEPDFDKYVEKLRKEIENDKNHKFNFHQDVNIKNKKFSFKVYRQKEDPFGNEVKADKIISGRTTYWSPKIQN